MAIKKGMVHLTSKLILNNVLFVPELNCNLILIAQLVNDNFCEVKFTKQLCVIWNFTTRSSIGVGESKRGVYYFKNPTTERVQLSKVVSYDTWHCTLGLPSSQTLFYISRNIRSSNKNDLCGVCLRAKQTRMSFLISENKASNCLNLTQ